MKVTAWISFVLVVVSNSATTTTTATATNRPPLIFDSDYGPFIDDVFALGLLLNSDDLIDLKLILATSEQPELSAQCMAAQCALSQVTNLDIAIGATFPPHAERGSVCALQGLMKIAMEPQCREAFNASTIDLIPNGVEYMAEMLIDSDRDDWIYLVVGGQTSLKMLIEYYPEAAAKIDTLVVMAGNFCGGYEPYPGVMAPTDETNIGCDPAAANYVLDGNNIKFNNVYYVPVEVADEIQGDDYKLFVDAANSGHEPAANATLEFYKIWSDFSRADETLLIHNEAMKYAPATESTPQFDPVSMLLLEIISEHCEDRIALVELDAIHFYESSDEGLQEFPAAPRSAYSVYAGTVDSSLLPEQCPNMTEFTFDPATRHYPRARISS